MAMCSAVQSTMMLGFTCSVREVNPETWAVSKSDFFMKEPTGQASSLVAGTQNKPRGFNWRSSGDRQWLEARLPLRMHFEK